MRNTNRKNKNINGVPFVVTYHPLLNSLYGIIRENIYLLNMDQKVKEVGFRSARKLSSYLVRTKLYPLKRRVNSYKCCCNGCKVFRSITETDMFVCNNGQRSYNINRSFVCFGKCLIYMLTCNCC